MTSIGPEKMDQPTLKFAGAQSIGVDISKATLDAHAYPVGLFPVSTYGTEMGL